MFLGVGLGINRRSSARWAALSGSALDIDFVNDKSSISGVESNSTSPLTVSRASTGYAENSSGTWTSFAANVARRTNKGLLVEEARTNSIRNNSFQGAAVGAPGTNPTNWTATATSQGLSKEIVAIGVENGLDYIDLRYSGTASSTSSTAITFESSTGIAATSGQTWTESVFYKLVAGSFANLLSNGFRLRQNERDVGGVSLVVNDSGFIVPDSTMKRATHTYTTVNASTAFHQPQLIFNATGVGVAIDFTLRIYAPQFEPGSFATSPIRTTSAAVTRSADLITAPIDAGLSMATDGSVFVQFDPSPSTFRQPWQIDDGSNANSILLDQTSSTSVRVESYVSAVGTNRAPVTINAGVRNKVATAWASSDWANSANGGAVATNTVAGGPAITGTTLRIGSAASNGQLCNYIQRIGLFSSRLPNATLQALTA